jgi:hypothetical protein
MNKIDDKENTLTKVKSNPFSNKFCEIKQSQSANNMEISMMIPTVCDSDIELGNESKCFGETAASERFVNFNTGFKQF